MSKSKRIIEVLKEVEITENDVIGLIRFGMDAMSRTKGKKRTGAFLTTGSVLYTFGRRIWRAYQDTKGPEGFGLIISESEERLYSFIMSLVYQQSDREHRRNVHASLLSRDLEEFEVDSIEDILDPFEPESSAGREVILSTEPSVGQKITYAGVTFSVIQRSTEAGPIILTDDSGSQYNLRPTTRSREYVPAGTITLTFSSEKDRDTFVKALEERFRGEEAYRATVFVQNSWGGFQRLKYAPVRNPESVVLEEGQMERIVGHIRKFITSEQKYVNLGIPWHTGILFYGPPGTGKSSLASMLASSLNYDTYIVSLSSVKDDATLVELMSNVRPRNIVLLEDIDIASAATTKDDSAKGVTKGGLLNVLDGPISCHGSIVIMTTNHPDQIQSEILRPGRVDIKEEIGYMTDEQMRGICEYFIGSVPEDLPFITKDDKITPAELIGVLRDYMDDLSEAGPAIQKFLQSRKTNLKELGLNADI